MFLHGRICCSVPPWYNHQGYKVILSLCGISPLSFGNSNLLCSPGWPGNLYVQQVAHELTKTHLHLTASRIKGMCHYVRQCVDYFKALNFILKIVEVPDLYDSSTWGWLCHMNKKSVAKSPALKGEWQWEIQLATFFWWCPCLWCCPFLHILSFLIVSCLKAGHESLSVPPDFLLKYCQYCIPFLPSLSKSCGFIFLMHRNFPEYFPQILFCFLLYWRIVKDHNASNN